MRASRKSSIPSRARGCSSACRRRSSARPAARCGASWCDSPYTSWEPAGETMSRRASSARLAASPRGTSSSPAASRSSPPASRNCAAALREQVPHHLETAAVAFKPLADRPRQPQPETRLVHAAPARRRPVRRAPRRAAPAARRHPRLPRTRPLPAQVRRRSPERHRRDPGAARPLPPVDPGSVLLMPQGITRRSWPARRLGGGTVQEARLPLLPAPAHRTVGQHARHVIIRILSSCSRRSTASISAAREARRPHPLALDAPPRRRRLAPCRVEPAGDAGRHRQARAGAGATSSA